MTNMNGYKTSKDYKRLKELVESGIDIVCFTTYDFDQHNREPHEPMWTTDVCRCRYFPSDNPEYTRYSFSVRGLCYGDYWVKMDNYTFEDLCESLKIEFIEPTE